MLTLIEFFDNSTITNRYLKKFNNIADLSQL